MTQHPQQAGPNQPDRAEFHERFARSFEDPRFDGLREAVEALEELAWQEYCARQQPPHDA